MDEHKEGRVIMNGNVNEVEGNECGDAKEYRKRATEAKGDVCVHRHGSKTGACVQHSRQKEGGGYTRSIMTPCEGVHSMGMFGNMWRA